MWLKNRYLIISLISLFLFIITAELVRLGETFSFDLILRELTQSATFMLGFMKVMTEIGSGEAILLLTSLLLIFLWLRNNKLLFWFLFSLSVGGVLLNFGLKYLYQRERPGAEMDIEVFGNSLDLISYSFPSGHTMRSVILLMFIIYLTNYLSKKWLADLILIVSIFLLICIPFSRVVLDVHYISDIVAAVLVSVSWFYGCLFLFKNKLQ
ncbi:phosphatase PAP2 family protein [Bacillus alkalicellulosilyticus]|uniref:phosphatase PAP2 family protein n=1 Tax=Alkalihalobacterium alkalicellulosilyticum TaxID=1912214 RepID=UPI00099762F8|nr:phosphatase PAP2 family protein [Bacillus alkalicellulosilyticus]